MHVALCGPILSAPPSLRHPLAQVDVSAGAAVPLKAEMRPAPPSAAAQQV